MTRSILDSSLAVILTVGMAACGPAAEDTELPAVDVATELNQLYADFDEEYLILNPLSATFRGDNRVNDKWYQHDPLSDEYAAAWHEMNTRFREKLQSYDSSAIDGQDLLSYEIFQLERQNAIERHDSGYDKFESLTPINQFFSMPSLVVMLVSGAVAQPFKTPEDYDNWIARSSGFLDNVDLSITRMREGVELGVDGIQTSNGFLCSRFIRYGSKNASCICESAHELSTEIHSGCIGDCFRDVVAALAASNR